MNPQSTLLLGQARGAALAALVSMSLPVSEYTALQMKKAIVGHGHATKDQVQLMVQRLLELPGLPGKDASDALGWPSCTRTQAGHGRHGQGHPLSRKQHAPLQRWAHLLSGGGVLPPDASQTGIALASAVHRLGVRTPAATGQTPGERRARGRSSRTRIATRRRTRL